MKQSVLQSFSKEEQNAVLADQSQLGQCQLCRGESHRLLAEKGIYRAWQCTDCSFVHATPLPTAEELVLNYADQYQGATCGFFSKVESKMRRMRRRISWLDWHLAARRGGRLNQVKQIEGKAREGKAREEGKEKDQPLRFLDIGASGGFMVECARQLGYESYGLEPDGPSVAYARKHYPDNIFYHGFLEQVDLGGLIFDAVYCSEVIEHAPDINHFAMKLAECLVPGGLLYLTTPDIGHPLRPKDLTRWEAFTPPGHCCYFNQDTLTRLLNQHGFTLHRRRWSFKPGLKVLAVYNGKK